MLKERVCYFHSDKKYEFTELNEFAGMSITSFPATENFYLPERNVGLIAVDFPTFLSLDIDRLRQYGEFSLKLVLDRDAIEGPRYVWIYSPSLRPSEDPFCFEVDRSDIDRVIELAETYKREEIMFIEEFKMFMDGAMKGEVKHDVKPIKRAFEEDKREN